jgi:MFS family permease
VPGEPNEPSGKSDDAYGTRARLPARAYAPVLATGLMHNVFSDFLVVTVPLWAVTLGATPGEIGIMIGARSILPCLLAIHGGAMMDRLGARRMMLVFIVCGTVIVPLYPLSPWFPALVALQMLTGLFGNLGWIGSQTLIARLGKGDPYYLGVFSFVTVIGLIWDLTGPWGAFVASTALGVGLFVSGWLVPAWAEHPDERSAAPRTAPLTWRDMVPRLADYAGGLALLAIPTVALGIAVALLRHTPSTIQSSFYITYLNEIGLSATLIGFLISCAEVTGAFGSLLAAPAMRRFSVPWLLIGFVALTIAMMAITPLLGGMVALLAVAQIVRGAGHGLLHPATFSFISRSLGPENQAQGVALRTTGNRLGAIVLPVAMGFIADAVGVEASFLLVGGALLFLVAILAVIVARNPAFRGR